MGVDVKELQTLEAHDSSRTEATPGGENPSAIGQAVEAIKPRLRGWLHTIMAPVGLIAALTLLVFTPTAPGRLAVAVYLLSSLMLFGNSAVYHRGHWNDRTRGMLRRFDHANIFVFIAGTYTPLAWQLLSGGSRIALLVLIWTAAALGVTFRLLWMSAPRVLYTALYILSLIHI